MWQLYLFAFLALLGWLAFMLGMRYLLDRTTSTYRRR